MIGKMLKHMRQCRGINQKEIANALNIAQTTLSGYETHYSNPDFELISKIAKLCNFEIVFLDKVENRSYTIDTITKRN